jgi:hypothetical protein
MYYILNVRAGIRTLYIDEKGFCGFNGVDVDGAVVDWRGLGGEFGPDDDKIRENGDRGVAFAGAGDG